jgi:hypothetical protein
MDIEELQKKVIQFRDAQDWAQYQGWRSEVRTSEVRRLDDLGWRSTKNNTLSKRQKAARGNIQKLEAVG